MPLLFLHNFGLCWAIFKTLSLLNSASNSNKTLSCFSPHFISVVTPLCETLKNQLCHFPTTSSTKPYIEIHYFLVDVIHIIWHNMLLTQHQLPVMCEIRCDLFVFQQNNMSADWACTLAQPPCQCVPFQFSEVETPAFIPTPRYKSSELKICSEMQQQVYLRKVCNMNGPTLWPGWHGFDLRVISNATDEWCKL